MLVLDQHDTGVDRARAVGAGDDRVQVEFGDVGIRDGEAGDGEEDRLNGGEVCGQSAAVALE